MAITPDKFGVFSAEVVSVKGECDAGHNPGDKISLSCWDSGGLCGFFYHQIFADLSVLQFGGQYPWAPDGQLTLQCPDPHNLVTIKISNG